MAPPPLLVQQKLERNDEERPSCQFAAANKTPRTPSPAPPPPLKQAVAAAPERVNIKQEKQDYMSSQESG